MTFEGERFDHDSQVLEPYSGEIDTSLADRDDELSDAMYCWQENLAALFDQNVDFEDSLCVKELAVELEWSSHDLAENLCAFLKSTLARPLELGNVPHEDIISMIIKKIRVINQTFEELIRTETSGPVSAEYLFDELEIVEILRDGLEDMSSYSFPETLQQKVNSVMSRMSILAFNKALGDYNF